MTSSREGKVLPGIVGEDMWRLKSLASHSTILKSTVQICAIPPNTTDAHKATNVLYSKQRLSLSGHKVKLQVIDQLQGSIPGHSLDGLPSNSLPGGSENFPR